MARLTLNIVRDDEGATLFVHPACGATMWTSAGGLLAEMKCDVCDPHGERAPDGAWTPVWAEIPVASNKIES